MNFVNSEFISCIGLCGEFFHIKCVAVTTAMLTAVTNCPNIHWYCHDCNDENRNISPSITRINDTIDRLSSSLSSDLLQFLNGFKTLMDKLVESVSTINIVQNVPNESSQHEKSKSEEHKYFENSVCHKEVLVHSNGKSTSPSVTSNHQLLKSVVISNIGKGISMDYLSNYLSDELKIDKANIHLSLLLPNGKAVDDMRFLQYKVTIPEIKYSCIMNPNTWPSNVRVRDFVNKPRVGVGVSLQSFMEKKQIVQY